MLWTLPLLPALAGMATLAAGDRPRSVLGVAAAVAAASTLALAAAAAAFGWTGTLAWSDTLLLQAALVPLSAAMAMLVPAVTFTVVIFAAAHEGCAGLARLLGLLLVFAGGMELIAVAADLLTLLIGWEIVGAASWGLIAHRWREAETAPSATYAVVATRSGDLGLFVAVMTAWVGTGSTAFEAIGGLDGGPRALVAFGVLVAAAAKSGQVPFAPWLFRAMAGPTSVSALLHAAAMVAAGAYALARLHPWLAGVPGFEAAAIAVGAATALAGGLVALLQDHAKKVLAASTSAQLGLMFVAVGAGYPGVAVIHLAVHAAFKAALFFATGIAERRAGTYSLSAMGLGRALPVTAVLALVAAAALAGLPPLGGGWSKEKIVAAAASGESLWTGLAVILAGGLSAAYAARFMVLAFAPRRRPPAGPPRAGAGEIAALALLTAATLVLSALWLAPVHAGLGRVLDTVLPTASRAETTVALAVALAGLLLGALGAGRVRHPRETATGEWLGLARLIEAVLVRPVARLAGLAAALDGRAVDRGVRLAAGLAEALARFGAGLGEAATDMLPGHTGRTLAAGGAGLRRLQTGLSHHYYAFLVAGLAAGIAILTLVGV